MKDNRRSAEAEKYRHLYGSRRWQLLRRHQLQTEPLCRMCMAAGQITAATVCDHIVPHRGDEELFWSGPFQSLCNTHHSKTKQREETCGFSSEVGRDGWPTDQRHPSNRR